VNLVPHVELADALEKYLLKRTHIAGLSASAAWQSVAAI
jgi:hypothetical protein